MMFQAHNFVHHYVFRAHAIDARLAPGW
jgi:hypothetical protein